MEECNDNSEDYNDDCSDGDDDDDDDRLLEAGRAFLLVGNSSRALEIDAAVVDIGKVAVRSWAEVVCLLPTVHQVLLDADAQVPVRPRDVHQLGEGVHPAQVVHLGQVLQLPSRLPIRCWLVD